MVLVTLHEVAQIISSADEVGIITLKVRQIRAQRAAKANINK